MSFWLSHVPDDRFDAFWEKVRASLAPGGSAYVIDSGWDMTSTAKNHARPDRDAGIAERKLNDGSEYRIVKVFYEPEALAARLRTLGFESRVVHTPRYFIHGPVIARVTGYRRGLLRAVDVRPLRDAALVHARGGRRARRASCPTRSRGLRAAASAGRACLRCSLRMNCVCSDT